MLLSNSKDAALRMRSSSNLKHIGLAIHNYNDSWDELPHNTHAADGKPLLSWRVHILPYLEHDNLFKRFNLNEAWDSPTNIRLLSEMPYLYDTPSRGNSTGGLTHYRGFSSPGAVFEPRLRHVEPCRIAVLGNLKDWEAPFSLASVRDGTANTLLVVEAADPVEWTKPDDLDASPGKPFPKMGGPGRRKDFQALLGDGSVRTFKTDTPEDILRALVTHSGGEAIPPGWD